MRSSLAFGLMTFAAGVAWTSAPVRAGGAVVAQNVSSQIQSNQNLGSLANRIDQDIAALNRDDTDYGGHRVAAIAQLRKAHTQISAAEKYAAAHGAGAGASNPGAAVPEQQGGQRLPQASSDANIVAVQRDVQSILTQINADSRDYGGHRSAAANALSAAISDLGRAIQYRQTKVHAPRGVLPPALPRPTPSL